MINVQDVHNKRDEITAPGAFFELDSFSVGPATYRGFKHAPADMLGVIGAGRQHLDKPFIVFEDLRYDYARFYQEVDALAAYLQSELGVKPGNRVVIAMQNCPHWSVSFYAILSVGAIAVPLNSWSKAEELDYLVGNADPVCAVVDARRCALLETLDHRKDLPVLITTQLGACELPANGTALEAALAFGTAADLSPVAVDPNDVAMIMYTSGSTGKPKGVVTSHRAVAQAVMNMLYLGYLAMSLDGEREFRGGATSETAMLTVPLFHGTGLISGLLLPAFIGSKVVMMRRWNTETAMELIDREKVTTMSSVPAILRDVITSPLRHKYSIESLLRIVAGGAATPVDLPDLITSELPHASRSAGFGMTETVAVGSQMAGVVYDIKVGSAGLPSPVMEFRIADANDQPLATGRDGEIQLRGITCLKEYWNNAEATDRVFTADGWMRTGDLGHLDEDGFVFITGRSKEIVIRAGENISPNEIEDAAYENPNVKESVVFGVPDQRMGEELAMVIYAHEGSDLDEASLREHLASRLAGFKVPKYITLTDEPLPRNNSEKLDKLACRRMYYPEA